jgi:hypothetical protein
MTAAGFLGGSVDRPSLISLCSLADPTLPERSDGAWGALRLAMDLRRRFFLNTRPIGRIRTSNAWKAEDDRTDADGSWGQVTPEGMIALIVDVHFAMSCWVSLSSLPRIMRIRFAQQAGAFGRKSWS